MSEPKLNEFWEGVDKKKDVTVKSYKLQVEIGKFMKESVTSTSTAAFQKMQTVGASQMTEFNRKTEASVAAAAPAQS